ncbi:HAMP domain-containing histidine kinase [Nocardioides sp. TRM66260-LWL]|uniref:HAMP domain-containing sensor histidine kinase n=1 Tax=Nocardioides sp. TRM66260-LWL TaxID=2874478 RepID=UPI001CC5C6B5|nr:HAMP domain-containing sensor histidine kinase [Nocardioides sp. TRM66260-LWL]MBZ5736402.1 HAMP domain-containing histidine kinase [Nocardioides sp. TRM66260-LWL]
MLVLVAAIATAAVIAALVGPPLFHEHMLKADHTPDPSERMHVEEAYRTASAISLGLAVLTALALALVVSWYLTRRFQKPLTDLTNAATEVSGGTYDTRVAVGGAGPELDTLASAFNTMAAKLAHTEDTRRRLLSDLAHELRTPIATLSAHLEGLDDGVRTWDEATRTVLSDQVARLARLAQDIDAVSRAEEGRLHLDLAETPIAEVVESALRSHRQIYEAKRIALEVRPGPPTALTMDRERIMQVLANLLGNAARHTPPGGTVTVAWKSEGDTLSITVTDTGEGITPEQLPHIFERFYRGDTARDREQQGSGIGLTISRAIAEAHRGTLAATSKGRETGSSFVLTLPHTSTKDRRR